MAGSDEAVPGWWLAADRRWYPPEDLPQGWMITADGSAARVPADPQVEPETPPALVAPGVPAAGVAGGRVRALLRSRRAVAALAAAVVALVIGFVAFGEGGTDDPEVLGRVETRPPSTTRGVATTVTAASGTSVPTSTSSGDPAKATNIGSGAKGPTTTLRVFSGLAPPPTTVPPRSGPVPTTTTVPPSTTILGTPAPGPSPTSSSTTIVPTTAPTTTTIATTTTATTTATTTTTTTTAPPTTTTTTTTAPPTTTTTTVPPTTTATTTTATTTTTTTTAPASCSASMSDARPREGSTASVDITSNRPGVSVVVSIRYVFGTSIRIGATSGSGGASIPFTVADGTKGDNVRVDVAVGGVATCSTSFRPH